MYSITGVRAIISPSDNDFINISFLFQVIAALSVSLVSMVVGFVSAYTSPAAETMKDELDLSDEKVRNSLQLN